MESETTDTADVEELAKKYKGQRNNILETLIKLVMTRKQDTPREEAKAAFDDAIAVIKAMQPIVQAEETGEELEPDTGDITLRELVHMVQSHEVGSLMIDGSAADSEERAWTVIAAVGLSADALYRYHQINYDDDLVEQYAQAAYAAYGGFTDNKNFQGNEMPAWSELPDKIQGAWQAAAHEISQLCAGNVPQDTEDTEGAG